jgi:hypothetical protein
LRCTGLGGLSITPTSKAIEQRLAARKAAAGGDCSCRQPPAPGQCVFDPCNLERIPSSTKPIPNEPEERETTCDT